jgi:hypothetical protein
MQEQVEDKKVKNNLLFFYVDHKFGELLLWVNDKNIVKRCNNIFE